MLLKNREYLFSIFSTAIVFDFVLLTVNECVCLMAFDLGFVEALIVYLHSYFPLF